MMFIKPKFSFKLIATALVFVFLFQPLVPVFAQQIDTVAPVISAPEIVVQNPLVMLENPIVSPPDVVLPVTTEIPIILDNSQPDIFPVEGNSLPSDLVPPQDVTLEGVDKDVPLVNELTQSSNSELRLAPSVSQLTQKLPEIDKNTGALNYNYSVAVPLGRNNFQPEVGLSYNSGINELNNIVGFGWTLNIPYIKRINKNGSDKFYDSSAVSYFYSSLDGELAIEGGASYIARTENGSFNKYTLQNNQWIVIAKNGTQYKFGYETASRQDDPLNPSNVYKWMLQEIRDTNDNYISYSYFKDAGQIYPLAIKYTGDGTTDGIFEIDFQRILRTDNTANYSAGFSVKSNYLISEINTKINNDWVNKYVLTYAKSQSADRSLLSSITMSGKDSNGNIVVLPMTSFSYQSSTFDWTQADSSWNFPNPNSDFTAGNACAGKEVSPVFADLNKDGLSDLVTLVGGFVCDQNYNSQVYPFKKAKVFMNTGNSWSSENSSWNLPDNSFWKLREDYMGLGEVQFPDLNGDGFPDVVEKVGAGNPPNKYYVYMNTGSGWSSENSSWNLPELPNTIVSEKCYFYPNMGRQGNDLQAYFPDLNGDGLPDLIQTTKYLCDSSGDYDIRDFVYINTGSGWILDSTWGLKNINAWLKEWHGRNSDIRIGLDFADFNSDGLSDIVIKHGNSWNLKYEIYINTGHGWTTDPLWDFPMPSDIDGFSGNILETQFADFNGDGLVDLREVIQVFNENRGVTYTNNGHGWSSFSLDILNKQGTRWILAVPGTIYNVFSLPQFPDLNGDGVWDFLKINAYMNFGENKDFEYLNTGKKQDLLNQINYQQGGSTVIDYKTLAQYVDSGNIANKSPYTIFTVSKITNSDGFGNNSTFSYKYKGGIYFYQGPFDKQFSGYEMITQTDSDDNITKTYYHTGNGNDSAGGQYQDNYFKISKPYRIEQYDNTGKIYQATINKWDSYNLAGNAGFVKLIQTTEQNFNPLIGSGQTHKDKAESYDYNNGNGNQIQKIEWGEVNANEDGSFTDVGNDKRVTNISYALGDNILGSVSNIIIADQSDNKIKENRYYYDDLELGSVSLGNQTKQENWIKNLEYASFEKSYNTFGLITQAKDANGNATIYSYDDYNIYPAVITNALNQSTYYNYNYANGKVTQTIDNNGNTFRNTYDGLGRILKTEQPDQADPATLVTKNAYVYTDTFEAVSVQQTNYLDSSNAVNTYNYYDGLGRIIQTKKSAENNNFETKDYVYDNRGNLQKESLTYFTTGSGRTLATGDTTLYTSYNYDAVGRVVLSTNSVGTTTNAYSNWKLTTTDANGKSKDFYKDAYGNLIQVDEHNLGATYSTVYNYDYFGNLTKLTDALGNARNFTYDGLGRRLTAQDLHNSADSIFGVWKYIYDNAGNLISLTDPKNQTVNYSFDALNRKTNENYTGNAGVEATFIYDSGLNGNGRLWKSVSSYQTEQYEYSATGDIIKDTKTIDAKNFITQYNYDRQGNQILVINPDNSQIKNIYNSAGLLDQIQKKESTDSSFNSVVLNFDYSPLEQITTESFANGVTSTNTYDPAKFYRLTNKTTTNIAGAQLQNLAYTYDSVGNIIQLVDNSATDAKKTVTYTYDDLYRLLSSTATNVASGQQAYIQTYTYDAIGNLLTQTLNDQTTTYSYQGNLNNTGSDYANPDAVTKIIMTGIVPAPIISNAVKQASMQLISAPIISSIKASIAIITQGNLSTLSWTLSGDKPTSLTINEIGSVLGKTRINVKPIITTTYIITATNSGGTATKSVTIIVKPNRLAPVISTYSSSPIIINKGQSTTLSWKIIGPIKPTSLTIDNSVGSVLGTTSKIVAPLSTTTYALTATNRYGIAIKSVTITVNEPPPPPPVLLTPVIDSFTTDSAKITLGQSATLSWVLSGGALTSLSIDNSVGSVLGTTSKTVSPTVTTTYILTSTNSSGTAIQPVTVIVNNPAPITITNNYQYDRNGNVINDGVNTYAYDYNSRLISATNPSASSGPTAYAYDPAGQRIKVANSNTSTVVYYPSKHYNTDNTVPTPTITKHIFANGIDVATVQGTGTNATIYYTAVDSLNSSSVMTNSAGAITQTLDYFPFGQIRIDTKPAGSTFNEQRKYIGQEFDADTNLSYLNARYYNSAISRFTSQDPVFWNFDSNWLADPQNQNAYAYARNNPITLSDPSGNAAYGFNLFSIGGEGGFGFFGAGGLSIDAQYVNGGNPSENGLALIISYGGTLGWGNSSISYPKPVVPPNVPSSAQPYVLGLSGGIGSPVALNQIAGSYSPNTTKISALNGVSDSFNINTFVASGSIQLDSQGNPTYSISKSFGGKGTGGSVSNYPIQTQVLTSVNTNTINYAKNASVNFYQSTLNSIQNQINKIQATINLLLQSLSTPSVSSGMRR